MSGHGPASRHWVDPPPDFAATLNPASNHGSSPTPIRLAAPLGVADLVIEPSSGALLETRLVAAAATKRIRLGTPIRTTTILDTSLERAPGLAAPSQPAEFKPPRAGSEVS